MSNTFVISDTHWGHNNICHYRPQFKSIDEHDGLIMENTLRTLGKRDTLWLLGDCFFDENSLKYLHEIRKQCQTVHFVPGNHDTDNSERQELLRKIVKDDLVSKFGSMMKTNGFWLTHPPMHPQELYGKINIHGHVHQKTVPNPMFINVSCENVRYTPVSISALRDESKRSELLVHYGPFEHECDNHRDSQGIRCLICDKHRD